MIGALVIGVLGGLVFPITMLLGALLFDAVVVLWVLFHMWHDHWSPKLTRVASHHWVRFGVGLRRHGHFPRPAH
jgi:hypothetical protein